MAECADVPALAAGANCFKETRHFQTMPEHDEEKCRAHGKQNCGQRDAAMQFVHAANPLREVAHPEQENEEWSQRNQRPQRDVQLSDLMRKNKFARSRYEYGHHQPAVHPQVCAPRILFAAAEKDFIGNVWFVIHNETSVKHPCHVSSILYTLKL